MDETVLTGQNFDKGAELLDGDDGPLVHLADSDLLDHAQDDFLGTLQALTIAGIDVHRTVVLDIDLSAGLGNDALDGLATGANDQADLILRNLHGLDTRSVLAHLATVSGKGLLHVIKDEPTVLAGIVDCDGHELVADTLEFEIQLESGDTDFGAA